MTTFVLLLGTLILAFAAFARVLGRLYLTGPIVFVAAGGLMSMVGPPADAEAFVAVKSIAEVTLVLVLFHDAAQVRPRQIGAERGPVLRLLLVGFPLAVLAGVVAARIAFPGIPVLVALLLAATLAPTDAGLGAATVLNPVVPVRVRRILNVESGLNDGLATPVVLFAVAALAGQEGLGPVETVGDALRALGLGVGAGVVVGAGGGLLLGWSRGRGFGTVSARALGALMLPLLAYVLAEEVEGNAFVAAFVAGTAFAGSAAWLAEEHDVLGFTELLSEPLAFGVWMVFGFAGIPVLVEDLTWAAVALAVASLTVVRMVPVALALVGTHLRAPTVAFVGWFGPRGLASIVFVLLAVETVEISQAGRRVLAAAVLTVLLSVIAHGVSADPLAERYGAWVARVRPTVESASAAEPRARMSRRPGGPTGGEPPD